MVANHDLDARKKEMQDGKTRAIEPRVWQGAVFLKKEQLRARNFSSDKQEEL